MTLHIFLLAGEESGDRLGEALIHEIREAAPGARFTGLGGQRMREAGCELLCDLAGDAVMGVWRVLLRLRFFARLMRRTEARIRAEKPDIIVPIDYPGFNLRLLGRVRDTGIPIAYYVSPQVWAWKRGRLRAMRRLMDRMLVLFPFETEIYQQAGIPVSWVGHPLFDRLAREPAAADFARRAGISLGRRVVGLLPGSRRQEMERNFPEMLAAARLVDERLPGMTYLVAAARTSAARLMEPAFAESGLSGKVMIGQAHEILRRARAAMVCSGTATLEALAFETPMTIHYRVGRISECIGRKIIATRHIGMVNILAGRQVVPEFFGAGHGPRDIADALEALLVDGETRRRCQDELANLYHETAAPGASARAAKAVLEVAGEGQNRRPLAVPP